MRMWMTDPKIMCSKHLLGEHLECHMFIGAMRKKKKLDGYLSKNLLEPLSIFSRHIELSKEMINRGYNHKSPLTAHDCFKAIKYLSHENRLIQINKNKSFNELMNRCQKCSQRRKPK